MRRGAAIAETMAERDVTIARGRDGGGVADAAPPPLACLAAMIYGPSPALAATAQEAKLADMGNTFFLRETLKYSTGSSSCDPRTLLTGFCRSGGVIEVFWGGFGSF